MTGVWADERMSDVDALVWAVEREPRQRTTIAALAMFDDAIDEAELRHRVERAARVVPRLRQRVINDPLGIAAPRWSLDPDFRLSFHLRRLRLHEPGEARLLEVIRDLLVQPFDRSRPLWEFTLIDGLRDGASALLLKSHHCVSDGVGGVEMMLELFDLQPIADPTRRALPPPPTAAQAGHPVTDSLRHESARVLGAATRSLDAARSPRSADDVAAGARRLGESLGSAVRMFRFGGTERALRPSRSAGLDLRMLSMPLDDLRHAGARVGGTINDAFVTAVAIGAADHHRSDLPAAPLRIGVPINTRTADAGVGNHWTPGRIDVAVEPGAEPDAVADAVRRRMRRLRDEPAHDLLPTLAAGLRRLPATAIAALMSSVSSRLDVAASNVPGSPVPLHLCGRPVAALVPFGPLSGCAVNVTLLSHAGTAHVGVSSDPAAVADPDGLLRDLEAAFTAVVKGS